MTALVAQLNAHQTGDQEVAGSNPPPLPSRLATFCHIDHEIFSMVILSLPLIQEGPLSVSVSRIQLVIRRSQVRPPPGRQHSFMTIDHEIFSMVILSLPLIQEGQL